VRRLFRALAAIREFLRGGMIQQCLRTKAGGAQVAEVPTAAMTHRLAGYPAGCGGTPLPVESTLAKMPSLALLSQATRFPNAHAPQRTLANGNTAGLQQVHFASNRVSLKPAHCMRGLLRFDTVADPWQIPQRSRTCQNHASRSELTEFACRETVLIYSSHKTALCKRSSSTG